MDCEIDPTSLKEQYKDQNSSKMWYKGLRSTLLSATLDITELFFGCFFTLESCWFSIN